MSQAATTARGLASEAFEPWESSSPLSLVAIRFMQCYSYCCHVTSGGEAIRRDWNLNVLDAEESCGSGRLSCRLSRPALTYGPERSAVY